MTNSATVSVVIPTYRRPHHVVRAVRSALDQTQPPAEIVVVMDGPDEQTRAALTSVGDPRLVLIEHPESLGAGAARNTGVGRARGDVVAFLDDDDQWFPEKLELQLRAHLSAPNPFLTVSATAAEIDHEGNVVVWPLRGPRPGESIPEYLFVRRQPGEGALFTPSLMVFTELARKVPMPTHLRTHEEWDWLVSLHGLGVRAIVVPVALGRFDTTPRRVSVSALQDWRDSLTWATSRRDDLGEKAYSAFILTEVGRAAAHAHRPLREQAHILGAALRGQPRALDVVRHLLRPAYFRLRDRA